MRIGSPPTATWPSSGRVDLHTHSTASDGSLSPDELVRAAATQGVAALSLTDHDTLAGLAAAARIAGAVGVRFVPGVELSCENADPESGRQVEVLGYFVHPSDPVLAKHVDAMCASRQVRARKMVDRLQALGARLQWDDVAAQAGAAVVGRPHVAQALVRCGFATDLRDAFDQFLGVGRRAHVPLEAVTPERACAIVRAAGGVPVLAHPVAPGRPYRDPGALRGSLVQLADAGLGGIECFYPGYTARTTRWLLALADHFGLVPTGGSDYHGPARPGHELGCVDVPADTVDLLERAATGPSPSVPTASPTLAVEPRRGPTH